MEETIKRIKDIVIAAYFIALSTMMHFFIEEVVYIGGIGVTYRHIFALIIVASAVLVFLVRPNLSRAAVALKDSFIMYLPLIVMLTVSLLIWMLEFTDTDIMKRGISYYFVFFSNISSTLAAAAFLYLFGKKGIWYYISSFIISNMIMIGMIVLENGLGPFLSEFIVLLTTFASITGDVIIKAEIHELSFCTGIALLYIIIAFKNKPVYWIFLILSGFCFCTALKRIGVLAIILAVLIALGLRLVRKISGHKTVMKIIAVSFVLVVFFLVAYIGVIKSGLFELLQESGLETSGRDIMYNAVDPWYEFSPTYMGKGMAWLPYQLAETVFIGAYSVHNDFLQFYIDLGFWGYIAWIVSMTFVRTSYFGRDGYTDSAILIFVMMIYIIIVSLTDNTMNYPLFNGVVSLLAIGSSYEKRVREDEMRRFEYVSSENRKVS